MEPKLSKHFSLRKPSAIRLAQQEYMKRNDGVNAINVAIGNVSLPMHPAMQNRMRNLGSDNSPFAKGVVKYSATVGYEETNKAFLNIIASSNFETEKLYSQITDGGSQAMELALLGICGPAGTDESPLLLIDAAYTNYETMANRVGRKTVSVTRHLDDKGKFSLPNIDEINEVIRKYKPGGLVVIPYDNPTGQFYDTKSLEDLARLCVDNNMWMVSDEAYRELHYVNHPTTSIWGINNDTVPGIEGRRISIETSSKVWNACGLRIGALITDNESFHTKSVAENTANLCSNTIGQYIFGSLAHESLESLREWYKVQRNYYEGMLKQFTEDMHTNLPGVIVSNPDASIYSVVDVRNLVPENFKAQDFVMYCASKGSVDMAGDKKTVLASPMAGFYGDKTVKNPGETQMRIAYVAPPEEMKLVPELFSKLLNTYLTKKE